MKSFVKIGSFFILVLSLPLNHPLSPSGSVSKRPARGRPDRMERMKRRDKGGYCHPSSAAVSSSTSLGVWFGLRSFLTFTLNIRRAQRYGVDEVSDVRSDGGHGVSVERRDGSLVTSFRRITRSLLIPPSVLRLPCSAEPDRV